MSVLLDQTFLQPHWRTVLWGKQRKKCETCANMTTTITSHRTQKPMDTAPGMRCTVAIAGAGWRGPRDTSAYCIDAREIDAACGPDAKLYKPKETK